MVRWFGLALLLTARARYELESEGDIYRPRAQREVGRPRRIGDTVGVTPLVALPVGLTG